VLLGQQDVLGSGLLDQAVVRLESSFGHGGHRPHAAIDNPALDRATDETVGISTRALRTTETGQPAPRMEVAGARPAHGHQHAGSFT
jgi:hypothetical protein